MANMESLFEILDASDADDLDFAKISAQAVEEPIDDSCSCSCTCC